MATRERGAVAGVVEVTIAEHTAIYDVIAERSPERAQDEMARRIKNAAARPGHELDLSC